MSMNHPIKDCCGWANALNSHYRTDYNALNEPRLASRNAIIRGRIRRKIEERDMLRALVGAEYWE